MPHTHIDYDHVHVCHAKDLPQKWAADLARAIEPKLPATTVDLAQERVVPLGDGVLLAHVRTSVVEEATIAAFKATDVDSDPDAPWLWLLVLIPDGEVAKHLGWLAHLAAVLRDDDNRRRLKMATTGAAVADTLEAVLAVERTQRFTRKSSMAVKQVAQNNVMNRMIIAILKGDESVDQLLTLYVEHDVQGATIMDGIGMGEHLAAHLSLFAGFRMAFKSVGRSHVVVAVVPIERTDEVLELTRIAIKESGTGIAWAIDVAGMVTAGGGG